MEVDECSSDLTSNEISDAADWYAAGGAPVEVVIELMV